MLLPVFRSVAFTRYTPANWKVWLAVKRRSILAPSGPRIAVAFLDALASVAPLPLDLGTVELLDVVAALELGR
jgi:hypothetical protein